MITEYFKKIFSFLLLGVSLYAQDTAQYATSSRAPASLKPKESLDLKVHSDTDSEISTEALLAIAFKEVRSLLDKVAQECASNDDDFLYEGAFDPLYNLDDPDSAKAIASNFSLVLTETIFTAKYDIALEKYNILKTLSELIAPEDLIELEQGFLICATEKREHYIELVMEGLKEEKFNFIFKDILYFDLLRYLEVYFRKSIPDIQYYEHTLRLIESLEVLGAIPTSEKILIDNLLSKMQGIEMIDQDRPADFDTYSESSKNAYRWVRFIEIRANNLEIANEIGSRLYNLSSAFDSSK